MNTQELKDNVRKIMTSEFKDSEKSAGLRELAEVYSRLSGMSLYMAKVEVETLSKPFKNPNEVNGLKSPTGGSKI